MYTKQVTYGMIPVWLIDDDAFDGDYGGCRWWTNGRLLIRIDGKSTDSDERVPELLSGPLIAASVERLVPEPAVIQVPSFSDDELSEAEGPGGHTFHYKVKMGPGIWASLPYVAIIDYLYDGVEWFGRGPFDPMVARKNGEMVAVLMPAPLVLAYLGEPIAPTET